MAPQAHFSPLVFFEKKVAQIHEWNVPLVALPFRRVSFPLLGLTGATANFVGLTRPRALPHSVSLAGG